MTQKLLLIIYGIIYILGCSYTKNEILETKSELKFTVNISESVTNKIMRQIYPNSTKFIIEFFNNSNDTLIIQKPISGWNLFLAVKGMDRKNVNSSFYEFISPVIDNSIYITMLPLEKKSFSFKISDFGKYKTSFKNISKIVLEYIPQDVLAEIPSVCSESFNAEIDLK